MHFDRETLKNGAFESIVTVKGRLGYTIPILAIVEGETIQDIFSVLKTGVYDYTRRTDGLKKYKKKVEELILWRWYTKNKN